ncbi:hypothetical protein DC008_34720 [Streptomyces nigra]|nr:hypothetical protein DC008_34720 [Streptomyces nigra]
MGEDRARSFRGTAAPFDVPVARALVNAHAFNEDLWRPSACLDARPWAVVRHHVAPSAPCSPGRSAAVAGDGAGSKRAKVEGLGVRLATPDAFAALVADYLERGRSSGWSPMEPSAERRPPSARHRPTAPGRPPPSSRGFRVLADPRHEAAGGSRSQPGSTGVGLRPPETLPFR